MITITCFSIADAIENIIFSTLFIVCFFGAICLAST